MTKTILLATAAVFALSAGASAGVVPSAKVVAHKSQHVKHNAGTVLYDQHGTDTGSVIVSQNFESSFDAYDAQAADDFVVPGGHHWKVTEVDVTGSYFQGSGPSRDQTVTFYKDAHGIPGKVIASGTSAGDDVSGFGSFNIALAKGGKAKLAGGNGGKTYWVSVVSNQDFVGAGEWGWGTQTTVVGNPSQWQNPGGGFLVCPTWEQESICVPSGQGDHLFTIRGHDK